MKEKIEIFLEWAEENGWNVQRRTDLDADLPCDISTRYPIISEEYKEFLKLANVCAAPDDCSWFLCLDDYYGSSDSAYGWNEIETMCLCEAKEDDEWKQEITEFWDVHLPIYFSVKSGYTYYALNTGDEFGSIVGGYEPEFEDTNKITSSFLELLYGIMENTIEV